MKYNKSLAFDLYIKFKIAADVFEAAQSKEKLWLINFRFRLSFRTWLAHRLKR